MAPPSPVPSVGAQGQALQPAVGHGLMGPPPGIPARQVAPVRHSVMGPPPAPVHSIPAQAQFLSSEQIKSIVRAAFFRSFLPAKIPLCS